jgi:hypothetical protein
MTKQPKPPYRWLDMILACTVLVLCALILGLSL